MVDLIHLSSLFSDRALRPINLVEVPSKIIVELGAAKFERFLSHHEQNMKTYIRSAVLITILPGLLVTLCSTNAVQAQPQVQPKPDPQIVIQSTNQPVLRLHLDKLFADYKSIEGVRGGGDSKKPVGQYLVGQTQYRSGYEKLSKKELFEWYQALFTFQKQHAGGWRGFKQIAETKNRLPSEVTLFPEQNAASGAMEKSFIPYKYQAQYAKKWFEMYSKAYRDAVMKDWWINDAILDGNLMIGRVHLKVAPSADGVAYEDAVMSSLQKKE